MLLDGDDLHDKVGPSFLRVTNGRDGFRQLTMLGVRRS
jgi:hypothetical protein